MVTIGEIFLKEQLVSGFQNQNLRLFIIIYFLWKQSVSEVTGPHDMKAIEKKIMISA